MRVDTVSRPYLLCFADGEAFRLSSDEAQRLLDAATIVRATSYRVAIEYADTRSVIIPATRGGGVAFEVTR